MIENVFERGKPIKEKERDTYRSGRLLLMLDPVDRQYPALLYLLCPLSAQLGHRSRQRLEVPDARVRRPLQRLGDLLGQLGRVLHHSQVAQLVLSDLVGPQQSLHDKRNVVSHTARSGSGSRSIAIQIKKDYGPAAHSKIPRSFRYIMIQTMMQQSRREL